MTPPASGTVPLRGAAPTGWRKGVAAARAEAGQGLIELVVAMVILATAVAALLALLVAGSVSLQLSDHSGTALTLAENQIELYRGVSYPYIRLSATGVAAVPGGSAYMTANSTDATIPPGASGSQALDTTSGNQACTAGDATMCAPLQTVTGPDHRRYEIDTYITLCPNAGITSCPTTADPVKQVFVVVRDANNTSKVLARDASTFSSSTTATG